MSILVPGRVGRTKAYPRKWVRNQSDVMALFGAPAEEIYIPGEPAAGNITGKVAGNILTAVTTPLYQQPLTALPGDPLGAGFNTGTTDSFDAATTAVHNYTTGPFAALVAIQMNTSTGSSRAVIGRGGLGGALGWFVYTNSGNVRFRIVGDLATVSTGAGAPSAGAAAYMFAYRSVAAIEIGLYTSWGVTTETEVGAANAGDLDAASTFALGSVGATTAGANAVGSVIIWSGGHAEKVIAARATTLPAWWAL